MTTEQNIMFLKTCTVTTQSHSYLLTTSDGHF